MSIFIDKRAFWMSLIAIALITLMSGCEKTPESVKGFALPKGNIDRGKANFVKLGCRQCHAVAGMDLPEYDGVVSLQIEIGGEALKVKNYSELMTSVINPDHEISAEYRRLMTKAQEERGDSPMPSFNQRITVGEMIDLVAFLHSTYKAHHPNYNVAFGP